MPNTPRFLSNSPPVGKSNGHLARLAVGRGGFPDSSPRAVDYSPNFRVSGELVPYIPKLYVKCERMQKYCRQDDLQPDRRPRRRIYAPVSMPTKTRSVLVTGTSTGIGYDIARLLAARGWRVFAGVRREEDGSRVQALAPALVVPVQLDVTDATSIAATRDSIEVAVGQSGLDGLVNNAGIAVVGPVETVPLDDWRRQFETNVFGAIGVTQAFLPLLRRGRGRVVMISSISARISYPLLGPYAASKYALEAVTDALRLELIPDGISVTLIEPGPIKTPIWEKSRATSQLLARRAAPDLAARYGPLREKLRAATERSAAAGLDPAAVSAAVERALTARRPRVRQVIGRNARLGLLLKHLPDRWSDRLIAASLDIA